MNNQLEIEMTREFLERHPYELRDGRRFASLACAGHTINHADRWLELLPVLQIATGEEFDMDQAIEAYRFERRNRKERK